MERGSNLPKPVECRKIGSRLSLFKNIFLLLFVLSIGSLSADDDLKPVSEKQAIKEYDEFLSQPQSIKAVTWKLFVYGIIGKRIESGTSLGSNEFLIGQAKVTDKNSKATNLEYDPISNGSRVIYGDYLMTRLVDKKKDVHFVYLRLTQFDKHSCRVPERGEVIVVRGELGIKYPDKISLLKRAEKTKILLDIEKVRILSGENFLKFKNPSTPLNQNKEILVLPGFRITPTRDPRND